MGEVRGFDRLVESKYDAAGAPELWPEVLSTIADSAGAFGAHLFFWKKRENAYWFSAPSCRYPSRAIALYNEQYGALDPRLPILCRTPVGGLVRCQDYFDDGYVRRSEFYSDFLIPAGSGYSVGVRLLDNGEIMAVLGIDRHAEEARPSHPTLRSWSASPRT